MNTILVMVIVLSQAMNPVKGATVNVNGMVDASENGGGHITDSRGVTYVEVPSGNHEMTAAKGDVGFYKGVQLFEIGRPVQVVLE